MAYMTKTRSDDWVAGAVLTILTLLIERGVDRDQRVDVASSLELHAGPARTPLLHTLSALAGALRLRRTAL